MRNITNFELHVNKYMNKNRYDFVTTDKNIGRNKYIKQENTLYRGVKTFILCVLFAIIIDPVGGELIEELRETKFNCNINRQCTFSKSVR